VAQPDEIHANRTASVLSGMTDTEHSTTSGSNEEENGFRLKQFKPLTFYTLKFFA